jgi:hypothetical protein
MGRILMGKFGIVGMFLPNPKKEKQHKTTCIYRGTVSIDATFRS